MIIRINILKGLSLRPGKRYLGGEGQQEQLRSRKHGNNTLHSWKQHNECLSKRKMSQIIKRMMTLQKEHVNVNYLA